MAVPRFQTGQTALMLVDVQEKLLPHIHNADAVTQQAGRLIDIANLLKVPVCVTEQYRKGLGVTVSALSQRLAADVCVHEKMKFSAYIDPVRRQLQSAQVHSVVVCGIEAHVCVLQTCLELVDHGFVTAVVLDAIGSRHLHDHEAAVARMTGAGVVPTTVESIAFEWLHEAGGEPFKQVLAVVK